MCVPAATTVLMVTYNFKKTAPVPSGTDFVDIILSKTQRKTPTIIHKHYAIGRIRGGGSLPVFGCGWWIHSPCTTYTHTHTHTTPVVKMGLGVSCKHTRAHIL